MLWPVPLVNSSDFLKIFYNKKSNWAIDGYEEYWFTKSSEVLAVICEIEKKESTSFSILIPAYFCGQSLKCLRSLNINIVFYELDENLNPNYSKIEEILTQVKANIFLHVHYFGRIKNQNKSREFCNNNKLKLIEDCAHIIHHSVSKNWVGDYLFFSPHKHFPIKNAAVLYSMKSLDSIRERDKVSFPYVWFIKNLIKRYLIKLMPRNSSGTYNVKFSNDQKIIDYCIPSDMEINLLNSYVNRVEHIKNIRKSNLKQLKNCFSNFSSLEILSDTDYVPYILGINFIKENVQKYYESFLASSVPVMLWPDLPEEIKNRDEFLVDIDRTKNTIFFFLHEQININDYIKKIKVVLDAL